MTTQRLTPAEIATATRDQLTDELAAGGVNTDAFCDKNATHIDEVREAVRDLLDAHDPRTVSLITITWIEDRASGRGYLAVCDDDGIEAMLEWPGDPISRSSNSHAVAAWVAVEWDLDVLDVDHDGETIHATMRQR